MDENKTKNKTNKNKTMYGFIMLNTFVDYLNGRAVMIVMLFIYYGLFSIVEVYTIGKVSRWHVSVSLCLTLCIVQMFYTVYCPDAGSSSWSNL